MKRYDAFVFAKTPRIHFGNGLFDILGVIIRKKCRRVLILTGKESLDRSGLFAALERELVCNSIQYFRERIEGEPTPELIDGLVAEYRDKSLTGIVSIGGGSVIDAGKAVSAMILQDDSVKEYLEEVGTGKLHNGNKLPFIAVPTTAGTGSETTKNAVISRTGQSGFKKSLRHNDFVPDVAVVDPALCYTNPPHITAACGFDAFSQLLESFVSVNASRMTDALAFGGLVHIKDSLLKAWKNPKQLAARTGMSYAAMISGITLSNAGLGVVHGFAASIGGMFRIPHGVICGATLAASVKHTVAKLLEQNPASDSITKYAEVGKFVSRYKNKSQPDYYCSQLTDYIYSMQMKLGIPRLGQYGVTEKDADNIANKSSCKNNPVEFSTGEMAAILRECI